MNTCLWNNATDNPNINDSPFLFSYQFMHSGEKTGEKKRRQTGLELSRLTERKVDGFKIKLSDRPTDLRRYCSLR